MIERCTMCEQPLARAAPLPLASQVEKDVTIEVERMATILRTEYEWPSGAAFILAIARDLAEVRGNLAAAYRQGADDGLRQAEQPEEWRIGHLNALIRARGAREK